MATKKIVDAIPPVSGREYKVTTLENGNSKIEDVTQYEQEGSTFGAKEVQENCFIECDYSYSNKTHTITSNNTGAKNIKFFATHDFEVDDKLYLGQTELTIFGVNKLKKGDKIFLANSFVFGFIKNGIFYCKEAPVLAKRVFFNSDNPDVAGYAKQLMQSGFDGTVNIQGGEGAIAPVTYCMGQIITNGSNRCTIILYDNKNRLVKGNWLGNDWQGWYQFTGTAVE